MCTLNINWAVSNLFGSYSGLPISLVISLVVYHFGFVKIDLSYGLYDLVQQIFISSLSGSFNTIGFCFLHQALIYEDTTRVIFNIEIQ